MHEISAQTARKIDRSRNILQLCVSASSSNAILLNVYVCHPTSMHDVCTHVRWRSLGRTIVLYRGRVSACLGRVHQGQVEHLAGPRGGGDKAVTVCDITMPPEQQRVIWSCSHTRSTVTSGISPARLGRRRRRRRRRRTGAGRRRWLLH